uniref:Uncharacterized protein n=1 Tax=Rhizophora mucronata TaxID=61149 RepID=A0A2P2NAP5_RHIMU
MNKASQRCIFLKCDVYADPNVSMQYQGKSPSPFLIEHKYFLVFFTYYETGRLFSSTQRHCF